MFIALNFVSHLAQKMGQMSQITHMEQRKPDQVGFYL